MKKVIVTLTILFLAAIGAFAQEIGTGIQNTAAKEDTITITTF